MIVLIKINLFRMVLFFDSEYSYAKNEQIKCIAQHFHPFVFGGKLNSPLNSLLI